MIVLLPIVMITTQVVFSYTTANQLCTADKLQECYDILNKDGLLSATILNFPEEVMTEHCRRYKIFAECMRTTKPYCTEYGNTSYLAYQGLDDAYGFVCGQGFKEYVQYQTSCFKDEDVQLESQTCRDLFLARSNYQKTNVTDKKYVRARYCQYIDDYMDCIYNLLLSFCGSPAAKWHKKFDAKSVEPTMVAFGCPEWPITTNDSTTDNSAAIWVIALGAAIAVTGAMVAIGLALVVYSRCRCRRRSASSSSVRRSSTSADVPPPPYTGPPFTVAASASASASREDEDSTSGYSRSRSSSGSTDRNPDVLRHHKTPGFSSSSGGGSRSADAAAAVDGGRTRHDRASLVFEDVSEAGEEDEEEEGAVGGSCSSVSPSPFLRPYAPAGHFELPSPGSSILSYLQSSDDDTSSLISHTCDYY